MPVSGLHRQIAALALAAAGEHGFALGGNALLAHGVISRPTQDAGLFTGQEHSVQAAAGGRAARCGLQTRAAGPGGLTGIFPGMGEGRAEWIVTAPGGEQTALQLAYSGPGPRAGDHRHRPGPGPGRRRGREGVRAGSRIEPRDTRTWPLRCSATLPASRFGVPGGWIRPGRPGLRRCPAAAGPDEGCEIRRRRAQPGRCHRAAGTVRRLAPGRRSHRPATAGRERRRATARARPQPGPGTARAAAGVSQVRMTLTRPGHSSGPDRTTTLKPTGTTRRPSHNLTSPQDSLLSIITRGSTYYYRTARLPELN